MKAALTTLAKPFYLGLIVVVTVLLTWLYYTFSLRSAGEHTTIFTTTLATPAFEMKTFGPAFFYGGVALDVVLALLTAILLALTVASHRSRKNVVTGSVASGATVAVAIAAFG